MAVFKFKKRIIGVLTLVIIIVLSIFYYNLVMLPIIKETASAKVRSLATAAVNNAVFYAITEKTDYNNLITIYSDSFGKINMIQADSVKINALARETSKASQDSINKIGDQGIDLALGTLTGFDLIIGQGPKVHIKTLPVGTVNTEFYSEFTSCGINQTRHKIYIVVEATIDVILPFIKERIITNTEVLVSESVLLGEVPDTYMKLGDENGYKHLANSLTN